MACPHFSFFGNDTVGIHQLPIFVEKIESDLALGMHLKSRVLLCFLGSSSECILHASSIMVLIFMVVK
jgi:hypothetical protein